MSKALLIIKHNGDLKSLIKNSEPVIHKLVSAEMVDSDDITPYCLGEIGALCSSCLTIIALHSGKQHG